MWPFSDESDQVAEAKMGRMGLVLTAVKCVATYKRTELTDCEDGQEEV